MSKRAYWQIEVDRLADDVREARATLDDSKRWLVEIRNRVANWEDGKAVWGCEVSPAQRRIAADKKHLTLVSAALRYAKEQSK